MIIPQKKLLQFDTLYVSLPTHAYISLKKDSKKLTHLPESENGPVLTSLLHLRL